MLKTLVHDENAGNAKCKYSFAYSQMSEKSSKMQELHNIQKPTKHKKCPKSWQNTAQIQV